MEPVTLGFVVVSLRNLTPLNLECGLTGHTHTTNNDLVSFPSMDPLEDELRILFIDDEPLQLDLLRRIINVIDPKIEIDILSDPTKTVEKVLKTHYDCVVLDEKMPLVSGNDIIKMIKQVKDIPCITYTGYDVSEVEPDSKESGADKVIGKILNANYYPHLVKTVRETIQKHNNN